MAFGAGKKNKRFENRIAKLGTIDVSQLNKYAEVRDPQLDLYDKYVASEQYEGKVPWDAVDCNTEFVGIRKRIPRVIYNLGKKIVSTFATRMLGATTFPTVSIPDQPDDTQFINLVLKQSGFQTVAPELMKNMGTAGSALLRYYFEEGKLILQVYKAKYCYPELDNDGSLLKVTIRYTFLDVTDLNEFGNPKKKWFQLVLGPDEDVLFDKPEFKEGVKPQFEIEQVVKHGLGFVQGEWFRTNESSIEVDGESLLSGGVLTLIDEINYSLSQSSQAISYGQEPQVILSGMNEDEIDELTKSSTKAWNLGREGKAEFLEAGLTGVERAESHRSAVKTFVGDVTQVVMHDPEKMVAQAQSGRALEILNQPLVDLITQIRPIVGKRIISLLQKLAETYLVLIRAGVDVGIVVPAGYMPKSMDITLEWPPVFEKTMEDLKAKVSVALQMTNGNIISRETALRWLADDFGIEDVEKEIARVNTQKEFNAFGGF